MAVGEAALRMAVIERQREKGTAGERKHDRRQGDDAGLALVALDQLQIEFEPDDEHEDDQAEVGEGP